MQPLTVDSAFGQEQNDPRQKKYEQLLEEEKLLEKKYLQLEKEKASHEKKTRELNEKIEQLHIIYSDLQKSDVDSKKLQEIREQIKDIEDEKFKQVKLSDELDSREAALEKEIRELENELQSFQNMVDRSNTRTIPDWFKSNAKWWKQGLISDSDIINALENLIIQDVIPLDNFVKESSGLEHTAGASPGGTFVMVDEKPTIPSFQKDVFGFWSDGLVSDDEIVNSIGHLMSKGIINSAKIQGEIAERQAKFDQKMAELDAVLDSDSKFMDKIDDDGSITTINPDGSKTIKFPDESYTTFFNDGSRVTYNPQYDQAFLITPSYDLIGREDVKQVTKIILNPDGTVDSWEFSGPAADLEKFIKKYEIEDALVIESLYKNLEASDLPKTGMEQLTQVTALVIDGIYYPISQFTIWKWTGECDDTWHYHTPTTQAIAVDGETGIIDPDQENCGFGKVGEVQMATTFMSQDQIKKFRDRADSDPLTNEAMVGGSDDESTPVEKKTSDDNTGDDVTSGPVSIDESDDSSHGFTKLAVSPYDIEFVDTDGDGISDGFDDEPNKKSTKFGTNGVGLPGEIIDAGDLTIAIISGEEYGAIIIEVGTDGDSESVIINVMGVDLEFSAGTIVEIDFR